MSSVKYDIAVAGAGIAGIAAALAAARRGHKVALLEKQTIIGGLATSGLVYIYLPLCDGNNTQVTFGISEEIQHLRSRPDRCQGVCDPLARNVGCGTVDRLEHGGESSLGVQVRACRKSHASRYSRAEVGEYISEKV